MLACLVFGREARQFLTLLALRTVHEDRVEHRNDEQRENGRERQTADHGNADKMYEADGSPFTAHTTNPVPFLVISADERLAPGKIQLREGGRLADIAPTMLQILNLPQPAAMTGQSLLSFLSF